MATLRSSSRSSSYRSPQHLKRDTAGIGSCQHRAAAGICSKTPLAFVKLLAIGVHLLDHKGLLKKWFFA